jgi:hypothetical protein
MKKTLSILLALAVVLSLCCFPAAAADTEYALQVYTQAGENGSAALVKSYTADELAALKEAGTAGYQYYKGDAWQCVAATEYVTLESLLADAGVSFESGDTLQFTCTDGVYTKSTPGYDDIAAGKYYIDESGSTEVPAALAVAWTQGSLDGTTLDALAATATDTGSLRFVYGLSEEQYAAASAAGSRFPSGVVSLTVVQQPALTINTQRGVNGEAVTVASYSAAEIAAMAESGTAGYLYYKGDAWQCVAATKYVTLESLFADAGVSFESGDTLQFTCTDGVYTKSTPGYDDIAAGKYYIDESGSTEVPAALAVAWTQGSLDGTTLDALAATATDTGSLRFVYGLSEEQYAAASAAGSRFPSGVVSLTVVSKGFDDVTSPAAWYYDGVYAAYDAGLVAGMSEESFGLTGELTWAQAITFAVRVHQYLAGDTPYTAAGQTGEHWYGVYFDYALSKGLISAAPAAPDAVITRGDAAVIFAKAMGAADGTGSYFTDVSTGDACYGAVYALYNAGIVNGKGENSFDPSASFLRQEVATIVCRMIDASYRLTVS